MHELGVVSEAAARFLAEVDGCRVDHVVLEVGPGADMEVVEAAWSHVTTGTAAADVHVRWQRGADTLVCFSCSGTYHGGRLDVCPDCGGNGLVIEEAPEFTVLSWRGAD